MIKRMRVVLLLTVFAMSLFSIGYAQKTTATGVINGTVQDNQGLELLGVEVTVTSPSLMLPKSSTLTDRKGFFRFPELPTGYYDVSFLLSGFTTYTTKGVKVDFNRTISLNIKMELTTIDIETVVTAKAPVIDKETSSLGVNIDTHTARDFSKVYEMAPGVLDTGVSYVGIGLSVHGSAFADNNNSVDGINFGDPVGGANFTRVGYEIAEEYQIETSGHSAEYGGVRGGVFNIITKSGGNRFSGEANFYYQDKSLQSVNSKGTPFEGQFVGFKSNYDTTFQLGGPFIKDKLWFFASFSYNKRLDYVAGYPWDKQPVNTPVDAAYTVPYIKLAWQINPSMKLVGSWDYPPSKENNRGAGYTRTEESTWIRFMVVNKFSLIYSWLPNQNTILSAKFGYMHFYFTNRAKSDSPRYIDNITRNISGSYGYDDDYMDNLFQYKTDLTYFPNDFLGRHELKLGAEYQYSYRHRQVTHKFTDTGLGPYIYTRGTVPDYVMFAQNFDPEEKMNQFGAFVQDTWTPTKRLTLNLGLRYEYQDGIIPAQGEDREPYTYNGITYYLNVPEDLKPIVWNTLSPRLGAIYSLTSDGKTVLKVSFSKYYTELMINHFTQMNPNGSFNRYCYLNPDWTVGEMYRLSITSTASIDPNLKPACLTEFVFRAQRELLPNFVLSASYIRKWDRNIMEDIILEALDLDAIKKGTYVWTHYTPVTAVDPYDGKTVTFYNRDASWVVGSKYLTNPKPATRDYSALEIILDKKWDHNWQMQLSYVYSRPKGLVGVADSEQNSYTTLFDDPNTLTNAIGRYTNDIRHQLKLSGTIQAPFGIIFGTYFRAYSGLRYTRQIRSQDLGLRLNQGNTTIYAETKGSRGLPSRYIWDIRLEKSFKIGRLPLLSLTADCFNILNENAVTSVETLSSSTAQFEIARAIMDPRNVRLGIRVTW
jgi:outer membrane receptor protein involved in Fe transport